MIKQVTKEQAVESLYSRICPACGSSKGEEKSLCYGCFCALPAWLKPKLYQRIGQGYESAIGQALDQLGATEMKMAPRRGGGL